MERYMEGRLTDLHVAGVNSHLKQKLIAFVAAVFLSCFLPYLHIGVFYSIWSSNKPDVDRDRCTCDCFDTVFRGRYEWPPSTYKHVYFNATSNSLKIWLVVILGILAFYESIRYLTPLLLTQKIRVPMLALYVSSFYPHYYGWWGLFSYLNEDYYPQWYHQLFFSFTELLSTAMVVHLCNPTNRMLPSKLLFIINVNVTHIVIGSLDQFIDNVIYHKGAQFEAVRDFGLMIPDVFHVLIAYFELTSLAGRSNVSVYRLFFKEELMASVLCIVLFSLLGKNI